MMSKWFRCTGDSCCGVYGIKYNAGKIWHLEGVSKSKTTATGMADFFRKEWRGTRKESNIIIQQVINKGGEKLWAVYSWNKETGGTWKRGRKTHAKIGPCIEKDCVIEHEGRKFESGGSVVTDNYLIAYPGKGGVLKTWHGKPIGTWRIVASWRVNSAYGSYMHQIEATVDGITYTGRGFGEGMIFKGKRKSGRR